jgi:hypothetical protein
MMAMHQLLPRPVTTADGKTRGSWECNLRFMLPVARAQTMDHPSPRSQFSIGAFISRG